MKFSRNIVFPVVVHRWVGRIHNILMLISAAAAYKLSTVSATPFFIACAFYIIGGAWTVSVLLGWYFIRIGNIPQHKRWMTRMFACTFTAIMLRLCELFGGGKTPYWVSVWVSPISCTFTYTILRK